MNETLDLPLYREALLFLAMAGGVAPLFFRLRLSPVYGYLLGGVALGPYGLGSLHDKAPWLAAVGISNFETIDRIAGFGVVVLLFTMGLELSFERIRLMRRLVFGLGFGQVVVTILALTAIAAAIGLPPTSALIVASALSVSSTAIVIPVLIERKRLKAPVGRASFAVLLFQDLAVAPLLVMASAFSGGGERGFGLALVETLVPAALALAGLIAFGRLALRPFFHFIAETRSAEFFMAACLLVVLGDGLLAAASHLSMALGAFVAGLLLAETEYRREIEVTIEPFKGLLLGLYFVSVGAGINPALVFARPGLILGLAAAFVTVKALILFGLALAFRLPARVSAEMALLLGPGGEFGFVMIGAGLAGGLIDRPLATTLVTSIAISMLAIPALARAGALIDPLIRAQAEDPPEEAPPDSDAPRVIIVGYGRVGALIGDMLDIHAIPFFAVDLDARVVARAREAGKPVYYGDASRGNTSPKRRRNRARGRGDDGFAARQRSGGQTTRKLRPDVTLVARARDADHAHKLYDLGVTDAVPETVEASLQLAEATLVDLGVPMGFVIASIHESATNTASSWPRPARRRVSGRSANRSAADLGSAREFGGEPGVDRHRGACDHVPAGERQTEDAQLHFVAVDDADGVQRLHQVVGVDRAAQRAGARGRARPPVLLHPDVVEGEAGVGDEDERQQHKQRPRYPMRAAVQDTRSRRRSLARRRRHNVRPGKPPRRVAEQLENPHHSQGRNHSGEEPQRAPSIQGPQDKPYQVHLEELDQQ